MADGTTETNPDQAPQQTAPPADAGTGYESAAQQPQSAQLPGQAQTPNSGVNNVPTQNPTSSSMIAPAAAPDYQTPAVVLHPQQSPIAHAVQSVVDAIAGTTGAPKIATDSAGNKYVQDTKMTPGQQWRKIGGEVLSGAAAGLAAGKGAGNAVRAPEAGIEAQQANQKAQNDQRAQLSDEAQKENLQNANNQMLQMNMAHQAWDFTHHQIEASQKDVEFWNGQEDRLVKEGGRVLGTAAHNADIAGILHVQPDVMQQMVQNQTIKVIPNVDADGKPAGIKVIMMPGNYQKQVENAGAQFPTFNKLTGEYDWHKTSEPATKGELDAYWTAAAGDKMSFENQKAELAKTNAQTGEANANASKAPSEIAKNKAEASVAPSTINKNNAEASNARSEAAKNSQTTEQTNNPTLIDALGTGHVTAERMAYLLSKNPALLQAVTAKYPDFDGSKAEQYPKVYSEFTSVKPGSAGNTLNSGATAIEHLQKLQKLNTVKSHIPGTAAYNAYYNQLDTLAPELAKFYGDTTVPAIASLKSTLGATMPGNRQAAITTQAASMGKKFDNMEQTWKNAAPSAYYEAPMPNVSDEAKEARAALDPDYRQRLVSEQAPKSAAAPPAPVGATQAWHDTSGKLVGYTVNGKYQAAGNQ